MNDNLVVAFIVVANIVSVVGVVAVNKLVYRQGFTFATTLMVFHFLCTWGFVVLANRLRWFTSKKIEQRHYASLGLAQVASVAFVNLSLMHNSIGTYQLLKFVNVLVMCGIEYVWKGKSYTTGIYATLVVLVVSVSVATVTQVEFSAMGVVYGLLGCVGTAVYQILNKAIQTDHAVSPLQLLQYEQPFTALFAAAFALFTDDIQGLVVFTPTSGTVGAILISCVFAFGVNLTCYLIIGKTSPVTYSVVGHTKTIGILVCGFLVFSEKTSPAQGVGLAVAFGAICMYGKLSTAAAAASSAAATTSAKDEPAQLPASASASDLSRNGDRVALLSQTASPRPDDHRAAPVSDAAVVIVGDDADLYAEVAKESDHFRTKSC